MGIVHHGTTLRTDDAAVTAASRSNDEIEGGCDAASERAVFSERKFHAPRERWKVVWQASEMQARELYGLYKHVVNGPCTDDCPSLVQMGMTHPQRELALVTGTGRR